MTNNNRKKSIAQKHSKSKEQMIDHIVNCGAEIVSEDHKDERVSWQITLNALLLKFFLLDLSYAAVKRMYDSRNAEMMGGLLCLYTACNYTLIAEEREDDAEVKRHCDYAKKVYNTLEMTVFNDAAKAVVDFFSALEDARNESIDNDDEE